MPYADPIKRAEYMHQYHKANKNSIKKRNKKKYEDNKEAIKEYSKNYYQKNKEARLEYSKNYKKNNDEKIKEYAKLYNKAYYENNKALLAEYNKQYRIIHKNRYKLALRKANKRSLIFTLTEIQYIELITQPCYYCDNKLGDTFGARTGVGLDRLDNTIGYNIDNVVSCCEKCNIIRNNILTPTETKLAIKAVLEVRN